MKKLVFFFLILFCVNAFSMRFYDADQNTFFDSRGFSYKHFFDGSIEVFKENKSLGKLSLAIEAGLLNDLSVGGNWEWQTDVRQLGVDRETGETVYNHPATKIIGTRQYGTYTLTQEWDFDSALKNPKLSFEVVTLARIDNPKIWFILEVNEETTAQIDLQELQPVRGQTIERTTQDYRYTFSEGFGFDFSDLKRNGFEINKTIFGDGTQVNRKNAKVFALSINSPTLLAGVSTKFDPNFFDSGGIFPTSFGQDFNDFPQSWRLGADDGQETGILTVGMIQDVNGFDFNVPENARIQGFYIQYEDDVFCFGSPCNVTYQFNYSVDGGQTYDDINFTSTSTGGTGVVGEAFFLWNNPNLKPYHFTDANFFVKVEVIARGAGTGGVNMDYINTVLEWTKGADNNVFEQCSFTLSDCVYNVMRLELTDPSGAPSFFNSNETLLFITHDPDTNRSEDYNGANNYLQDYSNNLRACVPRNITGDLTHFHTTGEIGGATSFNNTVNYYQCESSGYDSLVFQNGEFTVFAWAKLDANTASQNSFIDISAVSNNSISLGLSRKRIGPFLSSPRLVTLEMSDINGSNQQCFGNTVWYPDNQWHFAAATFKNNEWAIYFDGASDANCTIPINPREPEESPLVGARQRSTLGGYVSDLIDEVGFINKALTSTDIAALYNKTLERFKPTGFIDFNANSIPFSHNTIDVNLNETRPYDSNLSIQLGQWNGANYTFADQNYFDGDSNAGNLVVPSPTANFAMRYNLYADINAFTSPVFFDPFSTNSYRKTIACPCSPSPDVNISCNSNCTFTSACNVSGGNFIENNSLGAGLIVFEANLTNWASRKLENTCQLKRNSGTIFSSS